MVRSSSGSGAAVVSPVRELDVEQLQLSFVQKLAASKLAGGSTPHASSSSAEARVLALCNAAHVHAALSLATAEERKAVSALGPLTDLPVVALARHCVAAASSNNVGLHCRVKNDAFLYAPYALPCAVAADAPGGAVTDQWLRLLGDLLLCAGRSGGEKASRQYETAIRALLAFHASDSAEGSPAQLQVPRPIMDALSGGCERQSSVGDPAALIRLLVEFGCLEDACLLAVRMIDACNAQLHTAAGAQKMYLPYSLFDLLLDHCQQLLPRLELSSSESELARVKSAFGSLTKTLQQHFSLLVLS